ncbi:hypothetical protein D3C85_1906450 [compost metagenome]
MKTAYENSYRIAKEQPLEYQQMSHAAVERMHDYCAFAAVQQRLADFFGLLPHGAPAAAMTDNA